MTLRARTTTTGSGATAVQVVDRHHGVQELVAHLGSAHSREELAVLMAAAHGIIHADQPALFDLDDPLQGPPVGLPARVHASYSQVLWEQLQRWWTRLGFNTVDDAVFRNVVLARGLSR